ncbi:LppP/LprE family lipoprotein [Neobacillus cucumis]|uniref:LppP/LprE family lipoprotein n=1 Tax=Neobacillus cucumis TaxID=1740721 RepID=UPI002E250616|nr:LppP/LprE family lipoprotein [Neobacillus cucumis]
MHLATIQLLYHPSSNSEIPSQIPANSKTNITLDFTVKGRLSGAINPKLGFQPKGNQPEQFQSLGSVEIPVPKPAEVSKPASPAKPATNKSTTNNGTANAPTPTSHNYQADIDQDLAVIKSKATISVIGIQWEPLIDSHPDAEVPDGSGGMLYAWNVIVNGDGDGRAQQIYFFVNNRYIGRDTAKYHLPSSVHAGTTGTIIATYQHYLSNDSMAFPTGEPFIVTFHWNGNSLTRIVLLL